MAALIFVLVAGTLFAQVPPDVTTYDAVLKRYLRDDGKVCYADLKAGLEPLEKFVRQIGAVSPESHPNLFPTRQARLAYWINTYNALVLWSFARDYPEKKDRLKSAAGRFSYFYRAKFPVGNRERTLADIENNTIRKEFNEPRIHFSIVCASTGCPWLSRAAYTADNLERQLDAETRRFLNQERNVHVDARSGVLTLSKIFDWFKDDFGTRRESVVAFVARYRENSGLAVRRDWRLRYFDYDWSINDARVCRDDQPIRP